MALADSIAALVTMGGQNLAIPGQVQQHAINKITDLTNAWLARLAAMTVDVYVNQATGSDNNPGTVGAPLASIAKALQLTPPGGLCRVRLKAAYTVHTASLDVADKKLIVQSDSATKHQLSFERYIDATLTPNLRFLRSFRMDGGGAIALCGITVNVPALDGAFSAVTAAAGAELFAWNSTFDTGLLSVSVLNCDVVIPATPYASMINVSARLWAIEWFGNTLPGAVTSLLGRVISSQTNTAGVATNTLSHITTNLASI